MGRLRAERDVLPGLQVPGRPVVHDDRPEHVVGEVVDPDASAERGARDDDWVADIFFQETWLMQREGQLTGALPHLRTPEGRIHLAGSDYALGWVGFIDGAIESALDAPRAVAGRLSS